MAFKRAFTGVQSLDALSAAQKRVFCVNAAFMASMAEPEVEMCINLYDPEKGSGSIGYAH